MYDMYHHHHHHHHHCLLYAAYLYMEYISETKHIAKQYNVAAILSLLFMAPLSLVPALVLMYFYISTFRSTCSAQYGSFM
jgi:hypothetical protein